MDNKKCYCRGCQGRWRLKAKPRHLGVPGLGLLVGKAYYANAVGSQIPEYAIGIGVLAVVGIGLNLLLLLRRQPGRLIPIWLFFSLGYLSIQPWLDHRIPPNHIIHYSNTHRWTIGGQIDTQPWQIKNRTRFDLRVASLEGDHETHGVTGLLRVTTCVRMNRFPHSAFHSWTSEQT